MLKYIIRRLIQAIPTFIGITILSYALMSASGNPVSVLSFSSGTATARDAEKLAIRLGVNDPWPIQYLRWMLGDDWMRWDTNGDDIADASFLIPLDADGDGEAEPPGTRYGILRGDFGRSFVLKRPALQVLTERLPATIELGVVSLLFGTVIGVAMGIYAAIQHKKVFDQATRIVAVIFDAIPAFFLSLLLLLLFGSRLGWLPLGQRCAATLSDTCPPITERLEYLVLPTFVLATGLIAGYSRFTRASMLDVVSQDYIRTARAKGLTDRVVWFRHGARNALIPIATFLGPAIPGILGGRLSTRLPDAIIQW
jgi:peptide/nickel transport system permease protein